MRRIIWLLTVSLLGLGGLRAAPAWAYVREVTSTGVPIAWHTPCVSMRFNLDAPPPVLTATDVFQATNLAMAAWSYPQVPGTDIRLSLVLESQVALEAGYDKQNIIVFRRDNWCRTDVTADAGPGDTECYPASALAVTSIFKNTKTGEILDADIEFNAIDYSWGDLVGGPSLTTASTADFQNALTHELGHVVGLDHNCFTPTDGPTRLFDNTGAPAVDCYNNPDLPEAIANATMYPSVVLSDTARRSLSADDELGVVQIYPHAHELCPPPATDGGCNLVATPSHARRTWPHVVGAGLLILVLVAWRVRRGCRTRRGAARQH